jgi:drug/metabolite transporter (DMT)-like permease
MRHFAAAVVVVAGAYLVNVGAQAREGGIIVAFGLGLCVAGVVLIAAFGLLRDKDKILPLRRRAPPDAPPGTS